MRGVEKRLTICVRKNDIFYIEILFVILSC